VNGSRFVHCCDALELLESLPDESVDLVLTDPPYSKIVKQAWDNQWRNSVEYAEWFCRVAEVAARKLKHNGSFIFFGGIGAENERPFWRACMALDTLPTLHYRNVITWKKRRAYGKSHDYLYCREEIAWYSRSSVRTEVIFNIPLTNELRGYDGFSPKYKAKSPYKRVSNVWVDIPELMAPKRETQKPLPLLDRLVLTHSNIGDLIVDPFVGWGTTGISALRLGRKFIGCDLDTAVVDGANERCLNAQEKAT
jgi:site-specific DNA-methyltransferase (adenine-specific)